MAKQFIKLHMNPADKAKWASWPKRFKDAYVEGFTEGMAFLRDEAKKFDGVNVPRIRTGNLRDSITSTVKRNMDGVVGFLGSDSEYAAMQEYGGTITARRAKYLVFKTNDGWRRVKSATIPPRPYLRTAVESNQDSFTKVVQAAVIRAWEKL